MKARYTKLIIYLTIITLITLPVLGQVMLKTFDTNIFFCLTKNPLSPSQLLSQKINIEDNNKTKILNKNEISIEDEHKLVSIVTFLNHEKTFRLLNKMA